MRPPGSRKKSPCEKRFHASSARPCVTHGYFKSFDGTKLFYSIEGKGKPLVFCYGLVCSSLHWTYQIEHFKENFQTIWFDYRGHHNSEVPKDLKSLTLENIAKDLSHLLNELHIQEAVFLGHSMGVNVLLELYRREPHRVLGMVLANGTPKPPLETLFNHNFLQEGFKLLQWTHDRFPNWISRLWNLQKTNPLYKMLISLGGFNPYLTPKEDIDLYIKQVSEMDPRILLHLIENYNAQDATSWLHTLNVPTLILAGEKDRVIPLQLQELLHQLIPGSELQVVKHGSHCPQMDLPDLVNHKIENFLASMNYGQISEQAQDKPLPAIDQSWAPGVSFQSAQGKRQSIQAATSNPIPESTLLKDSMQS